MPAIRTLRIFLAVARGGSFAAAGEEAGLTAAAVGQQMRALEAELGRPLFDRGAAFLEREMDAGRLRRYDARQLLLTGYGAVLSYVSDAPLMTDLLGTDPMSEAALAARREHVVELLRNAVAPDA